MRTRSTGSLVARLATLVVAAWAGAAWRPAPPPPIQRVVLYDADCAMCQRWRDWAVMHGAWRTIRFEACLQQRNLRHMAGIDDESCQRAAFLVEGPDADGNMIVAEGAAAVAGVLAALPNPGNLIWRMAAMAYPLPGIRAAADAGYRWIAHHRHRLPPRGPPTGS